MHGSHFGKRDLGSLPPAAVRMSRLDRDRKRDERTIAEESPVALVYDGTTVAVVMATPADLADLAVGFSLTEGIVRNATEIEDLDVVCGVDGIEIRVWLTPDSGRNLKARQRRLVGPTGCGLCGIESLSEAVRTFDRIAGTISLHPGQIEGAVAALSDAQRLNQATHATHAAGFYLPNDGLVAVREDVGRHNALDKLAGALAQQEVAGQDGAVILTSRVSIEMVQKAAAIGSPIIVAISAPTALAIRAADAFGIALVAIARGATFEIFSHPEAIRR